MPLNLRIVEPAGRIPPDNTDVLIRNIDSLEKHGHTVEYTKLPPDEVFDFHAGPAADRAHALTAALRDDSLDAVICARGGYGASDILDLVAWESFREVRPKTLVGYSDISCLHSALIQAVGWKAIHGPMPGVAGWESLQQPDVASLLRLLENPLGTQQFSLEPLSTNLREDIEGQLFGGCFSVLTNLLGTRFLQRFSTPTILFFEDISEPPGRWTRYLHQWKRTGQLENVVGVIWAEMTEIHGNMKPNMLKRALADRLDIPCFSLDNIGHCQPNWPIRIGTKAVIQRDRLLVGVD